MAIKKRDIEKLKELKQFFLQNGHCYVPNTKDNQDLYGWTIIIKQSRPRLSKELIESGPTEQTVTALIDNLKFRLELMYRLKDKLNELNNVNKVESFQG